MKPTSSLPLAATALLADLGAAVLAARLRRRQSAADLAMRIAVSLPTLRKLEKGDPGVSLGTFVCALSEMGLGDALREAVRPENDRMAAAFEATRLPVRIRRSKSETDLDDL